MGGDWRFENLPFPKGLNFPNIVNLDVKAI